MFFIYLIDWKDLFIKYCQLWFDLIINQDLTRISENTNNNWLLFWDQQKSAQHIESVLKVKWCKCGHRCAESAVISLRHDAYQNTVLAAANRAEVLHGLCCQLITPLRRDPSASFSRAAWLGGSKAPVPAIRAPALRASPLISAGKRPLDVPLPLPSPSGARQAARQIYESISGADSFKVKEANRRL